MSKNKLFTAIISAALLFSLTACNSGTNTSETNIEEKTPIDHDNPRTDYSPEELSEIINEFPNMKAAENILSAAPKSLGHVSVFESRSPARLPFEEGLRNFKEALEYLSPGRVYDL